MAAYEPRFIWKDATIGEEALPVIIRSINPTIPHLRPTIAQSTLEGLKLRILHQLEEQSTLRTTSTDLAIQAGQYMTKVEIPPQYRKFAKVFSEKESQHFPPSRPWDHMIEFKKDAPEAIDCKVYPMSRLEDEAFVRGFTPLCPTWAVFWLADLLLRYSGFHQRCDPTR